MNPVPESKAEIHSMPAQVHYLVAVIKATHGKKGCFWIMTEGTHPGGEDIAVGS